MNIFDQILASAYYVFEGELNSHIIRHFITMMRRTGCKFNRNELQMVELRNYMEFDNHVYRLKSGYTVNDLSDFINFDMVLVFHNLKKSRDKYYSSIGNKEEPNFERSMQKIKRKGI